jgi:hypothetical protein
MLYSYAYVTPTSSLIDLYLALLYALHSNLALARLREGDATDG